MSSVRTATWLTPVSNCIWGSWAVIGLADGQSPVERRVAAGQAVAWLRFGAERERTFGPGGRSLEHQVDGQRRRLGRFVAVHVPVVAQGLPRGGRGEQLHGGCDPAGTRSVEPRRLLSNHGNSGPSPLVVVRQAGVQPFRGQMSNSRITGAISSKPGKARRTSCTAASRLLGSSPLNPIRSFAQSNIVVSSASPRRKVTVDGALGHTSGRRHLGKGEIFSVGEQLGGAGEDTVSDQVGTRRRPAAMERTWQYDCQSGQ